MKFQGIVKHISEVELVGENSTPKFNIVIIEEDRQHSEGLVGTVFGQDKIDNCQCDVGDFVEAKFSLKASQSQTNGNYYPNINVFEVRVLQKNSQTLDEDIPF